ncbi:unnamed protein product [Arabidopsis halleri]
MWSFECVLSDSLFCSYWWKNSVSYVDYLSVLVISSVCSILISYSLLRWDAT